MNKRDYLTRLLTHIECGKALSDDDAQMLIEHVRDLEHLCDDADGYDVHGTEGWRHYLGMDNEV